MYFPRALRQFLLGYVLLHVLAAVLFVWVLTTLVRNQMMGAAEQKMNAMALMLREHVSEQENGILNPELVSHIERLGTETGYRFTLIDSSGTVICDSRTGTKDIGPHANRPEILAARETGEGFSERDSKTLKMPMMYRAITTRRDNGIIRVAVSAVSIRTAIRSLQTYAWLFAIGMSLLTGLLMTWFSARTLKPLSNFTEAARKIGVSGYDQALDLPARDDEWGELSDAYRQMQKELGKRERKLTNNNQRLEAVLTSMIEGVLSIDPQGQVRMANTAACEMLALEYRDLVGKNLISVIRIPELDAAIEQTKKEQTFSRTEFETRTDPRRIISVRVTTMGYRRKPSDEPLDENALPIAIVLHDVTELRQLETMRSDFVANVSHELKTPLSSIKAFTETLLLGAINDQERNVEFVEQIEANAEMLNQQVHDLLELARIESKQSKFEIVPVNVNEFCEQCIKGLRSLAQKSDVNLSIELADPSFAVRADEEALSTVLTNLITNAIHYTPFYGEVTVRMFQKERRGVIQVRDTGIGIATENQARVFERFFRVDRARSRDVGGTGLGLAIVKHLTMALGGSVHLQSQIGKGSTFEVHLPLAEE